jgi:hypothetical protein
MVRVAKSMGYQSDILKIRRFPATMALPLGALFAGRYRGRRGR